MPVTTLYYHRIKKGSLDDTTNRHCCLCIQCIDESNNDTFDTHYHYYNLCNIHLLIEGDE